MKLLLNEQLPRFEDGSLVFTLGGLSKGKLHKFLITLLIFK